MPPIDPPMADDLLTPEQRAEFLQALAEGIPHGIAARGVGYTGTKLKACRRRDPEFRGEVEAALEEGRSHYQERLRTQARLMALSGDHPRMTEVELATHVPGYEHLRRNRIELDGTLRHGISLPPGWIENAPDGILEWLASLGGEVIEDAEVVELDPSTNGRGELTA